VSVLFSIAMLYCI